MNITQALGECLAKWKQISNLDFRLLNLEHHVFFSTYDYEDTLPESISSAAVETSESPEDPAVPEVPGSFQYLLSDFQIRNESVVHFPDLSLYKIMENELFSYILIIRGLTPDTASVGELAVCQVESLLTAYAQKNDKNFFMQKLLLGGYVPVELYNRARALHISVSTRRAVFLVETKQKKDETALATVRSIFSSRTRDFITSINDTGIIIVRELSAGDDYDIIYETAQMLVDMLNMEAMTPAWISYGNIAAELGQLSNAFQEARTALEIGKIFYSDSNVFPYNRLGIGRLIYQLPIPVCEMFMQEVFHGDSPDSIDEETLNIIRTFFENNLNLSETSRHLYVHRNTLVYRMEKLQKRYGLDIRTFEDALTFKLAMMVSDYIKHPREHLL
ncbi:MAG: helix-turn-helix domain-containing protein [Blautia sp.]|nr:helix-turn-helix domain-containing protein [Blautia sp.]